MKITKAPLAADVSTFKDHQPLYHLKDNKEKQNNGSTNTFGLAGPGLPDRSDDLQYSVANVFSIATHLLV